MEKILFSELEVSQDIKDAIAKMGFERATPIQEKSLPHIMAGKDVVAQAPTGTGKTLAFGIPLVEGVDEDSEDVEALVLCPTRELCIQITEELLKLARYKRKIKIVPIYGGQDYNRQISALKRRPQIIVATPGRLMDHMNRRLIDLRHLRYMVLDEADEMLNMGFREDIDTILENVPEDKQTLLFSATLSMGIKEITKKYQRDAVSLTVEREKFDTSVIDQYYLEIKEGKKLEALTRIIDAEDYRLCMVFCNTKRKVEEVTDSLNFLGYEADCLHGDMKQAQRDKVMTKFRKGRIRILVATDVAARGIDVDGIEVIFNYDIPIEEEYYIHRIGRTGRANKTGVSYTFTSPKQVSRLKQIMRMTQSKISLRRMPNLIDVEAKRAQMVFDELGEIIDNEKHHKQLDVIRKFLKENEEWEAIDVAAALLYLRSNKVLPDDDGNGKNSDRKSSDRKGAGRKDSDRRDSAKKGSDKKGLDKKDSDKHGSKNKESGKNAGDGRNTDKVKSDRRFAEGSVFDKKLFGRGGSDRSVSDGADFDAANFDAENLEGYRWDGAEAYKKRWTENHDDYTVGSRRPEGFDEKEYSEAKGHPKDFGDSTDSEISAGSSGSADSGKKHGRRGEKKGTSRLFINVGALDKMNRKRMAELFEHYAGIEDRKLSKIDVFGKFSFVSVPSATKEDAMNSLNGIKFKGRTIFVEEAENSDPREADWESGEGKDFAFGGADKKHGWKADKKSGKGSEKMPGRKSDKKSEKKSERKSDGKSSRGWGKKTHKNKDDKKGGGKSGFFKKKR